MQKNNSFAWLLILPLLTWTSSGVLQAQELNWRHNYAAARKEAVETGRPLLLDFGTEACVWCRKQDATTLRDPRVVKLLSERFIPVKVDGDRDANLTRALGIDSFPTLILASPEGKVLGRHEGYADVTQLIALLAKAPARAEPMAAAPITQVKTPRDSDKPVRAETAPAGSPTASSEMLRLARAEHDAGRYAESLLHCGQIVASNPVGAEGAEARRLMQSISSNPIAQRQIREQIDANLESLQPKLAAALER